MALKPQKLYSKLHLMSIISFIGLIIGLNFHVVHGKNKAFLILNQYHSPFFDQFFIYVTNFGDGLVWLILFIICLFFNKKRIPIVLVNFLISTAFALFLKRLIFSHELRPVALLKEGFLIHIVEGVKIHTQNSFPSGHTITAFAVACTIILLLKRGNPYKYLVLIMAFFVGFSRIYLAQHFPIDVIAGGFIGISSTFITIYVLSLFKVSKPSIFIEEAPNNLDYLRILE